ncbi:MAG: hypothetical protein A2V66_06010 [Ignavibacteria bacterium RBG_13_36_8]|nr:MAG: hypothetical protein A2V66_06010 [Ignavibacteria bacterium RBG_13_36_8]
MEGITGVVNWEDVDRNGKDYDYFRKMMTEDVNSAIEGALEAGASEIVVRDAHATARNIVIDLLNKNAKLLRDWSGDFKSMVEGIDEKFDAVIFIGYHAKAGTPNAILDHTMSSARIADVSLNGISLPEAGINALIAGLYNVPVVFVAGDLAICSQVKELFGEIQTFAVKEAIGNSAMCLHPDITHQKIHDGVKYALQNIGKYKPYKINSPYTLVLKLKNEESANDRQYYPGVERTGGYELTFKHDDLETVLRAMRSMY